jgi:hypothetical protein
MIVAIRVARRSQPADAYNGVNPDRTLGYLAL